ncbi:MAG: hypothetical protein HYZ50_08985 [Deltaproteobacteria bacterium]|nr:hypothetical protein [Deltaproteobacteria bacterium]
MVGIPGTEERLALAEIEDRLRRVRTRFNLYSLQHHFYRLGAALSLGVALLVLGAFLLPPWVFTLASWPLLVLLAFLLLFFLRCGVAEWTNLPLAARRIDTRAGLHERLSTLVAQLTAGVIGKEPPSKLWSYLLTDNMAHLGDWEVKKVAPSRVPWSFLPFLAAFLAALFVVSVPLLSSKYRSDPFSLENLQTLLAQLPDRLGQMADEKMSLLPDPRDQWGGSSLFGDGKNRPTPQEAQPPPEAGEAANQEESRSLASLPEELQKTIREALKGLDVKDPEKREPGNVSPDKNQLALRPADETSQKKPESGVDGKDLPKSRAQQQQQTAGRGGGQGNDSKGNVSPASEGGATQPPAQGSGMQQLDRAKLDRKNAPGRFQPDGAQVPGGGGSAGEGGPGAGSGTDSNLFGNPADLGSGARSFQLALDGTHERVLGDPTTEEAAKDEGGVIEKSTKNLSQKQSLDSAIRKAQVPPEYEEIVKRLFSRGESQ